MPDAYSSLARLIFCTPSFVERARLSDFAALLDKLRGQPGRQQ